MTRRLLVGNIVLEAIAISCVIGLNAAIGYATESEAERTINALMDGEQGSAAVLRSGKRRQIPIAEVVPGDVIELAPGTVVAADARLITADGLTVDEAALTGESLPSSKSVGSLKKKLLPLAERRNLVFKGTMVASGSGRALVVTSQLFAFGRMTSSCHMPATNSRLSPNRGERRHVTSLPRRRRGAPFGRTSRRSHCPFGLAA